MKSLLARRVRRLSRPVLVSVVAGLLCTTAFAQQPPPAAPQPKAAPKAPAPAPKSAPKQPAPQAAPQQPAPQQQQQQQAGGQQPLPVVYSPWTKICNKPPNQPAAKDICITHKEARLESGQPLATVAFVESEGEAKKMLRVTVPLGMQLARPVQALVDQNEPITGQYVLCVMVGCIAEFEIDAGFVGKAKKSQRIVLQAVNLNGHLASYPMPLDEFAKANEGPATDPKKAEEQARLLQEQLQKRALELQKGVEQGRPPAR